MPYLLSEDLVFPNPRHAWQDPHGLIAVGGDLSPERLMLAYQKGLFPWFSQQDPILWWSPDPRAVLFLEDLKVSRSLRKSIKNKGFEVFLNKDFEDVIQACAVLRQKQDGTWITDDMINAYLQLHQLGFVHCVSVYKHNELVGGLYGPSMGKFFFGESMFSRCADASKTALYYLVQYLKRYDFPLIDCQISNDHLTSLGAIELERGYFLDLLEENIHTEQPEDMWLQKQLNLDDFLANHSKAS